jgi:hypothetical protein
MAAVDPPGWNHSDRHPSQFVDRSAQGRLDPAGGPSRVIGGAAVDNKCSGVAGKRNLRHDSLNRAATRRNVDSMGKRFRHPEFNTRLITTA